MRLACRWNCFPHRHDSWKSPDMAARQKRQMVHTLLYQIMWHPGAIGMTLTLWVGRIVSYSSLWKNNHSLIYPNPTYYQKLISYVYPGVPSTTVFWFLRYRAPPQGLKCWMPGFPQALNIFHENSTSQLEIRKACICTPRQKTLSSSKETHKPHI